MTREGQQKLGQAAQGRETLKWGVGGLVLLGVTPKVTGTRLHVLTSGEGVALIDTHGCNVPGKVKRPHARNFTKVFSPLLLRVTKHI